MRTGRPPKPEDQRRNRAKPTHAQVVLPAQGRPGPAPTPPVKLKATEKRLWDLAWSTPQAVLWGPADMSSLARLVRLQADREAWEKAQLLAECRQLEDRFGMNPYARRQMQWVVEEPEGADEPAAEVLEGQWGDLRVVDTG